MKNKKGDESWRRRYIRILAEDFTTEGATREDLEACEQLIDSGFIDGKASGTLDGGLFVIVKGTTVMGRLFAEEQQQILAERSFWGRIKSGSGLFIGWLVGVVTSVLIHYLTSNG